MIDRNELFITVRDEKGNLLDPVFVTCSVEGGREYYPERLSKGVYRTAKNSVPSSDDCVVWRVQEKMGDSIRTIRQASDGGVYKVKES
jgi:hypothetical protein